MFYTDYQDDKEAKAFYDELVIQEESMLSASQDQPTISKGDDFILILTAQNDVSWHYECMYYQKDVILFVSITIGTSDINSINKEWLSNAKKFFSDLNVKNPFSLTPEINKLV